MRTSNAAATSSGEASQFPNLGSIDLILHLIHVLPFGFLHLPHTRLRLPSPTSILPSSTTVLSLALLTYFAVVSGLVYNIIVESPGIGNMQDRVTGTVYEGLSSGFMFLPGRVNGQYIIEGLSFGFMFFLGGIGLILMDLTVDRNRARSVRVSFTAFGISAIVVAYAMSMLFICIKFLGYLW